MNKPNRPKFLLVTIHHKDAETPDETFCMVDDLNTTEDNILELKRAGTIIGYANLDDVSYVEVQADG